MIELNQLRKNKEEFVLSLKKRGLDDIENDLNKLISLDDERKSLKTKLDNLLSESNKIAKEILIVMHRYADTSLLPSMASLSPLIIQYIGFKYDIPFNISLLSISILQKTPPSIVRGIKTKLVKTPI